MVKIPQIDKQIFQKFDVTIAYLFGSRAKDNFVPESDFDIAVLFRENGDPSRFFDNTVYLAEELKPYFSNGIDVVALNNAGSVLKYEAVSSGIPLYADNDEARLDFEVLSVKEYIDGRYTRDIYYNALKEKVEKGAF